MKLQLQRLRKQAGYSNRDSFADALGVNHATYKAWESGRTRLKLEDACDIADLLRCSLDELAGRDFAPAEYSDPRQRVMNAAFEGMNDAGKEDAVETVEKLSRIPDYAPAQAGASKSGRAADTEGVA